MSVIIRAITTLLFVMCCLLSSFPALADQTFPVMKPDRDELGRWIELYNQAPTLPEASLDILDRKASRSVLSLLDYIPEERDQGSCGNCWVWSGTGAMAIGLAKQTGVKDRLSTQYVSACNTGKSCCDGGFLEDLAVFYTANGYAVPWSNTNAFWQNGDGACNVECEDISVDTQYKINSTTVRNVNAVGAEQAQAVANIKSVLDADQAVWFGFCLPDDESWTDLYSFWGNGGNTTVYDFDPYSGKNWVDDEGGCHAVLIVGYEDDADVPYWTVLNSWATANGSRPEGAFRMKMYSNYDNNYYLDGESQQMFYFQTLTTDFDASAFDCPVALDSENLYFTPLGGQGLITVSAASVCDWTVQEDLSWLEATSGTSGTGGGEIVFSVDAYQNSLEPRTGTISVGGKSITITQYGGTRDASSTSGCFLDRAGE